MYFRRENTLKTILEHTFKSLGMMANSAVIILKNKIVAEYLQ